MIFGMEVKTASPALVMFVHLRDSVPTSCMLASSNKPLSVICVLSRITLIADVCSLMYLLEASVILVLLRSSLGCSEFIFKHWLTTVSSMFPWAMRGRNRAESIASICLPDFCSGTCPRCLPVAAENAYPDGHRATTALWRRCASPSFPQETRPDAVRFRSGIQTSNIQMNRCPTEHQAREVKDFDNA
jgi:hypothetical protein